MATIGLRDLYRAPITVGKDGEETYGTPVRMAKAISAEMSVEVAEAILYADDGADEVVKEFVSGEPFWGRRRTTIRLYMREKTTIPRIWQSASARRRRTACISIFGFTR